MKENEYQCAMCGGIFEKGWSDAEAIEEAVNNGCAEYECEIVCEDCFKKTPFHTSFVSSRLFGRAGKEAK